MREVAEERLAEGREELEMAMLDKEVAEEEKEGVGRELDGLREELEVVKVELEVLRAQGGPTSTIGTGIEGTSGGGDGKTTLAYIQLEKQNERLKEALIRLRDMSQESEIENRRRIADMERDVAGLDDLSCMFPLPLLFFGGLFYPTYTIGSSI